LRPGAYFSRLCRTAGLRHEFVQLVLWKRLSADDHFLYGEPNNHQRRREQRIELGSSRSDEYYRYTWDIHVHIGKRFNQHEPNGHDHLHADGDQCRRLSHVNVNRHRKHDR
jgi:hypothetical protein